MAKWVAHLCDSGACIFAGYVSPKDVIAVACGLMGDHPQLTLHVYRVRWLNRRILASSRDCEVYIPKEVHNCLQSNFFSSFLEGCETSESEVAISCLLRSLKRPVGLWRLHQVRSCIFPSGMWLEALFSKLFRSVSFYHHRLQAHHSLLVLSRFCQRMNGHAQARQNSFMVVFANHDSCAQRCTSVN